MDEDELKVHLEKLNQFCYVCGKFTPAQDRRQLMSSKDAVETYKAYFSLTPVKDVPYAPKFSCLTCVSAMIFWWKRKRYSLPFGLPMAWTNPGEHRADNCYVCANDTYGLTRAKRTSFVYKGVPSAHLPVAHSDELPVPKHPAECEYSNSEYDECSQSNFGAPSNLEDPDYVPLNEKQMPSLISQEHLDRIVRKLNLSHNNAMVLASELNSVHILAPDVKISSYKHRP